MIDGLKEMEALKIERQHIKFWKDRGQAKTNLHEGGFGGDVFKYYPEGKVKMIEKCRQASLGSKNAMYKVSWQSFASPEMIKQHAKNCSIGQRRRYDQATAEDMARIGMNAHKMWNSPGHRERYRLNNAHRWHKYDLDGNYITTFMCREDALDSIGMIGHMTLEKNTKLKKPYKKHHWIKESEKGVETIERGINYFHLVE